MQEKEKEKCEQRSSEELERLLSETEEKLRKKELEVAALNTLIDIAEENGVRVRKNFGAKR